MPTNNGNRFPYIEHYSAQGTIKLVQDQQSFGQQPVLRFTIEDRFEVEGQNKVNCYQCALWNDDVSKFASCIALGNEVYIQGTVLIKNESTGNYMVINAKTVILVEGVSKASEPQAQLVGTSSALSVNEFGMPVEDSQLF